jgi:hypothetical protein
VIETHERKDDFKELVSARQMAANAAKRDDPFLRHNVEAQFGSPARI